MRFREVGLFASWPCLFASMLTNKTRRLPCTSILYLVLDSVRLKRLIRSPAPCVCSLVAPTFLCLVLPPPVSPNNRPFFGCTYVSIVSPPSGSLRHHHQQHKTPPFAGKLDFPKTHHGLSMSHGTTNSWREQLPALAHLESSRSGILLSSVQATSTRSTRGRQHHHQP